MAINQERLKLLIEDLRTTIAPQITGKLRQGDGYCCMGRGCIVAIAAGVCLDQEEDGDGNHSYQGETTMFPWEVTDFFGFNDPNPMIQLPRPYRTPDGVLYPGATLGYANDTIGLSFAEIADALEATYITGTETE